MKPLPHHAAIDEAIDFVFRRFGTAMWHCIGLHMQMIGEGTGPITAMAATAALYRGMVMEVVDEVRNGA